MSARRPSRVIVGATLASTVGLASVVPGAAGADNARLSGVAGRDSAVSYLVGTQRADGGFDISDFPGFETPDVILGLAAHSLVGQPWNPTSASAAVAAVKKDGKSPFDSIDALVDGATEPQGQAAGAQAAKLLALVVAPTGQSATDFDPSDNNRGSS